MTGLFHKRDQADMNPDVADENEDRGKRSPASEIVSSHARQYFESTTIHGFAYWVSAPRVLEKVFWVITVAAAAICAFVIVRAAIVDWIEVPATTEIRTFYKPISDVNYPAITLCNPTGADSGQYVKAVYNNLQVDKDLVTLFSHVFDKSAESVLKAGVEYVEFYSRYVFPEDEDTASSDSIYDMELSGTTNKLLTNIREAFSGIDRIDEIRDQMNGVALDQPLLGEFVRGTKNLRDFVAMLKGPVVKGWASVFECSKSLKSETESIFDAGGCVETAENGKKSRKKRQTGGGKGGGGKTSGSNHGSGSSLQLYPASLQWYEKYLIERVVMNTNVGGKSADFCKEDTDCKRTFGGGITLDVNAKGDRPHKILTEMCNSKKTYYARNTARCTGDYLRKRAQVYAGYRYIMENAISAKELPLTDFGSFLNTFASKAPAMRDLKLPAFKIASEALFGKVLNVTPPAGSPFYPSPANLARLYVDTPEEDSDTIPLDSSWVSDLTTEDLIRLLRFNLWMDYKKRQDGKTEVQIINDETELFVNKGGLHRKKEFNAPENVSVLIQESSLWLIESLAPVITDYGLCYALNAETVGKTFKSEGEKMRTFINVIDGPTPPEKTPIKMWGSGGLQTDVLWLNVRDPTYPQKRGQLKMALNDWNEAFSVRSQDININAGHTYYLKMTPTVHKSTEDFSSLSIKHRGCRYAHETPKDKEGSSMFKYYSQKACVFNCLMKDLPCYPWDYPIPMTPTNLAEPPPTCMIYNKTVIPGVNDNFAEFQRLVNDPERSASCESDCLPNCEETAYDYTMHFAPLNLEQLCKPNSKTSKFALDYFWKTDSIMAHFAAERAAQTDATSYHPPKKYHYTPTLTPRNERRIHEHLEIRICETVYTRHLAKLNLEVSKPRVLEIVKDIKVTFPDILGTVGGTIGLFTGLSLISVVEIFYWIYRTIMAYFVK